MAHEGGYHNAIGAPGTVIASLAIVLPQYATTATIETLASFTGTNGVNPHAALTDLGGTLYGTTLGGGAQNDGTPSPSHFDRYPMWLNQALWLCSGPVRSGLA